MTQFLTSSSDLAVREAAQSLRDWQRDRGGLGVALVYGPVSTEDRLYHSKCPVDQRSVTALSEALDDIGARWKVLNPCEPDFITELAGYDVALSNLHGPYGEDGRLQGLLDYLRVPYCGSGVAASAVAADKILCKRVMLSLGVPTPGWWVWSGGPTRWNGRAAMVKPPLGGSGVGMSLVREQADLPGCRQPRRRARRQDHPPPEALPDRSSGRGPHDRRERGRSDGGGAVGDAVPLLPVEHALPRPGHEPRQRNRSAEREPLRDPALRNRDLNEGGLPFLDVGMVTAIAHRILVHDSQAGHTVTAELFTSIRPGGHPC